MAAGELHAYIGTTTEVNHNPVLALDYIVRSYTSRLHTVLPVKVVAVHAGTGTVDVLPMIMSQDYDGNNLDPTVSFDVPYLRLQAGTSAVVMDPVVGDIGLCLFAMRDISALKSTRSTEPVSAGSARVCDPSDGIYIGGILNATPTNVVKLSASGIEVQAAEGTSVTVKGVNVTLEATTQVHLKAPTIFLDGTVTP